MSIKIEKVRTYCWEEAVRGMRNPKNSWELSDSDFTDCCHNEEFEGECENCFYFDGFEQPCKPHLGENDLKLMRTLAGAGTDHGKFLRMITITMDITAPLYWWKEYDTYKVGTVANSCSTMHKIQAKEFTLDDFSHDRLDKRGIEMLQKTVEYLEKERVMFLATKDVQHWHNMIQTLPTSYNQRRTVQLNYAVALNMYRSRRTHKLAEWRTLCDTIKSLPYFETICLGEVE